VEALTTRKSHFTMRKQWRATGYTGSSGVHTADVIVVSNDRATLDVVKRRHYSVRAHAMQGGFRHTQA